VLKLIEHPKNRNEAFYGALRSFVSCSSRTPAIRADQPEMICLIILGSLSMYERGLNNKPI
jgi:hypothetical protein